MKAMTLNDNRARAWHLLRPLNADDNNCLNVRPESIN